MEEPPNKKSENISVFSNQPGGEFLGTDSRSVAEIINADVAELARLGFSIKQLAEKMKEITAAAIPALGNWVQVDQNLSAKVEEVKGLISCPWPDRTRVAKRITYVKNLRTGKDIKWSDLNIHLIEEHNFFEGRGSAFRIEPKELVSIIYYLS